MKYYNYYLFIIFYIVFFSCTNDNEKVRSLLLENDNLNRAFTTKDWEYIYTLKLNSEKYGIGIYQWSKGWDKETFIKEQERKYGLGKYQTEYSSYKLDGDTAETTNISTIVLVSDSSKKYKDTMYNYWIYMDKKWFLKDWNIQKKISESLPGDSTVRALTDSIHNAMWKKFMESNN